MSALERALADYLALRRSLGYELRRPALHMADFIAYLDERCMDTVTTEYALRWAKLPRGGSELLALPAVLDPRLRPLPTRARPRP